HRGGKGCKASRHVDYCSTCKVENPHLKEETFRVPGPVSERRIDKERKQYDKQDIRLEFDALSKRPRDQGRCYDGKFQLKDRKEDQRDGRCAAPGCSVEDILKHEESARITDKSAL